MVRFGLTPLDPFTVLRGAVNRLFDGYPYALDEPLFRSAPSFPALNVWEDEENLYVEAEIPGVKAADLETYAIGRDLTIKGKREPMDGDKFTYHRQERGVGEFTRVVALPMDVETDKIQASLKDGVLTLTLPKAKAAKARKITVNVG